MTLISIKSLFIGWTFLSSIASAQHYETSHNNESTDIAIDIDNNLNTASSSSSPSPSITTTTSIKYNHQINRNSIDSDTSSAVPETSTQLPPLISSRLSFLGGSGASTFNESDLKPWQFDSRVLHFGIDWYTYNNSNRRIDNWFEDNKKRTNDANIIQKHFDPTKPSIIHIPGWTRTSTMRMNKTTFNNYLTYPKLTRVFPDTNLADPWVDAGWNIGMLNWHSFADEEQVFDVERKVYSRESKALRWRDWKGKFHYGIKKNAGDLLVDHLVSFFGDDLGRKGLMNGNSTSNRQEWPELRITANSVGVQLILRSQWIILKRFGKNAGALAHRLVLLDPWGTDRSNCYLRVPFWDCRRAYVHPQTGETVPQLMERYVKDLIEAGVVIEYYKTSNLCNMAAIGVGGSCLENVQKHVASARLRFRGEDFLTGWHDSFLKRHRHFVVALHNSHVHGLEFYYSSLVAPLPKVYVNKLQLADVDISAHEERLRQRRTRKNRTMQSINRVFQRGLRCFRHWCPADDLSRIVEFPMEGISAAASSDVVKFYMGLGRMEQRRPFFWRDDFQKLEYILL